MMRHLVFIENAKGCICVEARSKDDAERVKEQVERDGPKGTRADVIEAPELKKGK